VLLAFSKYDSKLGKFDVFDQVFLLGYV